MVKNVNDFDVFLEEEKPGITNKDIYGEEAVNTRDDLEVFNNIKKVLTPKGSMQEMQGFLRNGTPLVNSRTGRTYNYSPFTTNKQTLHSVNSENYGGYNALVPVNALNLGVLFSQRKQILPKQPKFDNAGKILPFDKWEDLKMSDLVDEIDGEEREKVLNRVNNAQFASSVRWQELALANIKEETEEEMITKADDVINYKREHLNYGNYTNAGSDVNKYIKTISRNSLQEMFGRNIDINARQPIFEDLLNDALQDQIVSHDVLRYKYTLKQILISNKISISSATMTSPSTFCDEVKQDLFYDSNSGLANKYLSFVQMAQPDGIAFFMKNFIPKFNKVLTSMQGMRMFEKPQLLLDHQSLMALANTYLNSWSVSNGTGSDYSRKFVPYPDCSLLEVLYRAGRDANSNFEIIECDGLNTTETYKSFFNTYSQYSSSFPNAVRSYVLRDKNIAKQMDLIKTGAVSSYGNMSDVRSILDIKNYTQNSPFDYDITILNTFTDVLYPSMALNGTGFDLNMRFDFAQ